MNVDVPGLLTVIGCVVGFLLIRELIRDFYVPWLERRLAAERQERHDHEAWVKAMREANVKLDEVANSFMRTMRQIDIAANAATAYQPRLMPKGTGRPLEGTEK